MAAIKTFFRYLQREGLLPANPADAMDAPKLWRMLPDALSVKEVERLLAQPDLRARHGLPGSRAAGDDVRRGPAGLRGGGLTVDDVRFDDGCLRCMGKGRKERIVPLGESARAYLRRYIGETRSAAAGAAERGRSSSARGAGRWIGAPSGG